MAPWEMGPTFFYYTQVGTLQYCVIKPITAAITFILVGADKYTDGDFSPSNGYPYLAFITNCSQIWAMYCLILFYFATKRELEPVKPVPKFLVVKSVVFFTFWQSVLLAILTKVGVLHETPSYSEENIVTGIQDLLVCIEMFFAAIAHHYAFAPRDFHDPTQPRLAPPILRSVFDAVNVTDVYVDHVRDAVRQRKLRHEAGETRATLLVRQAPTIPLQEQVPDGSTSTQSLSTALVSDAQHGEVMMTSVDAIEVLPPPSQDAYTPPQYSPSIEALPLQAADAPLALPLPGAAAAAAAAAAATGALSSPSPTSGGAVSNSASLQSIPAASSKKRGQYQQLLDDEDDDEDEDNMYGGSGDHNNASEHVEKDLDDVVPITDETDSDVEIDLDIHVESQAQLQSDSEDNYDNDDDVGQVRYDHQLDQDASEEY
jgi:Organic solute transporter Ostalpha